MLRSLADFLLFDLGQGATFPSGPRSERFGDPEALEQCRNLFLSGQ